jgi:hypothetical protein
MRAALITLSLFLCGCSWPSLLVPVVGKPHFGNITNNEYHGAVSQTTTQWEFYFWVLVLCAALIFTPLGGILISKLRSYKAALVQTAQGIKHAGDPGLTMELSSRMSDATKKIIRKLKASGEV